MRSRGENMAYVITVLTVGAAKMLQHRIGGLGTIPKEFAQRVVPVILFAYLENLAAAGETRDFVCDARLMKSRKSLAHGVCCVLHQAPPVPVVILKINPNNAANAVTSGIVQLLDEMEDAPGMKNGVCIHADN